MLRNQQALPRLRNSFPGSNRSSSRWPAAWYLLLALCGLLLVGGYIQCSGYLRARSSSSSSGGSSKGGHHFSSSKDFEPLIAAVAALQSKAAKAAGGSSSQQLLEGNQPVGSVEAMQQLQQGADALTASVSTMARTLREQTTPTFMNGSAAGSGTHFLDVTEDLKSTADAMGRQPNVHGHVAKAGTTDIRSWMGNYSDARLDNFISWRVNRTRAGGAGPATTDSYTCSAADHPPLPFPGCHVFVNHKYKYIYIRSPKAASTSIVNVLGECNNKATRGHNSSSCMVLHFYWNSTELASENLRKMWKDYFVFGFVRNPWRRAYSLYKYLHSNGCMSEDKLRDPNCRVSWSSFCDDPWSSAEELHDKGCIKRSKSYLYFHMEDQFHCMHTADGNWAVDFIGRVDEPNADWAEVVTRLNSNRVAGVPEIPVAELEQKNVRAGNIKDPYAKPGAEQCFNSVSRWYGCDVEKFGFADMKQLHR